MFFRTSVQIRILPSWDKGHTIKPGFDLVINCFGEPANANNEDCLQLFFIRCLVLIKQLLSSFLMRSMPTSSTVSLYMATRRRWMVATLPVPGMSRLVFVTLRVIWIKEEPVQSLLPVAARGWKKFEGVYEKKENKATTRGDLPLGCQRSKFGRHTTRFSSLEACPSSHLQVQRNTEMNLPSSQSEAQVHQPRKDI